jgi:hypothetical protein
MPCIGQETYIGTKPRPDFRQLDRYQQFLTYHIRGSHSGVVAIQNSSRMLHCVVAFVEYEISRLHAFVLGLHSRRWFAFIHVECIL